MWYDIRYVTTASVKYPVKEEYIFKSWCRMEASSKAEALEQFGREYGNLALYAKPIANEWDTRDKGYWFDKWRLAMANMPHKIHQNITMGWVEQPKGETPLPTYIKLAAKGKMMIDAQGRVHELCKHVHSTREVGRASALGILLGYITWTGADHKRKRANSCAMLGHKIPESSRPRSAQTRELLAKLGSMDKDEIKRMLEQKRKQMNQ